MRNGAHRALRCPARAPGQRRNPVPRLPNPFRGGHMGTVLRRDAGTSGLFAAVLRTRTREVPSGFATFATPKKAAG